MIMLTYRTILQAEHINKYVMYKIFESISRKDLLYIKVSVKDTLFYNFAGFYRQLDWSKI